MIKKLQDYNIDEEMDLVVLLKSADVRQTKAGKQYLALTFEDTTGQIRGNFWDASGEDIDSFQAGNIVELSGKKELYQNAPQVKIYGLRSVGPDEGYDLNKFVKGAPMTAEQMQNEINQLIFQILNPTWNRIVRALMNKYQDRFYSYPAAKTNHHAMKGGLAYHTLSMAKLAQKISELYPQVDESLLLAGAILHDLGKTIELSGPIGTEYTVVGNLVGHIVLIDEEIIKIADELKLDQTTEDFLVLRHLVLAHHGLQEYGSPVRPQIMEAEILHQIDEMDASLNMMTNALERTTPGQFTDRIFALDNRRFYKPNLLTTEAPKKN